MISQGRAGIFPIKGYDSLVSPKESKVKRTKIIATLGPTSNTFEIIELLVKNGVDIVRLNFSHGTHADHLRVIRAVRRVSRSLERPIGILQDLQGPKIRIGKIAADKVRLKEGNRFTITTRPVVGTDTLVSTPYHHFPQDVRPGNLILIADGLIELRVIEVRESDVVCEVIHGGILESRKGVNLPGTKLSTPSLTEKDIKDMRFGIRNRVDFVALSFVRTPEDVASLKDLLRSADADIPVISKIEKPEAVENIDEIIAVSGGIMVARGDLGVEMRPEKVPFYQKVIIRKCIQQGIPVITATQMLETMRTYPTPTRAETSDVANAILDGTDAVMLSGETASGQYPVESVQMMNKIIVETETHMQTYRKYFSHEILSRDTFPDAISRAACEAGHNLEARAIIAFTKSGFTAALISKYRPFIPIIAFTSSETVRKRMLLNWGVQTIKIGTLHSLDEMIKKVEHILVSNGLADRGDTIVIVSGAPLGRQKTTNMVTLHRIGEKT